MEKMRVYLAGVVMLLSSPVALASGSSGMLTLVVGIPLLILGSAILSLMLLIRQSRFIKVVSIVLFVPVFLYSLYVATDAIGLLGTFGSENSMIGFAFFGLLSVCCFLFYIHMNRSIKSLPEKRI